MNGNEFIRRLRRLARRRGVEVEIVERHGKGSHARLILGDRHTTIKDRKKELSKALLATMLRQLGLTLDDLERMD